uniref:uncharacterized protein LOC120347139 isoform X1 n=1 Tax=Styela clava TaxID=7725 RepID=UPI00193ACAD0|nr:uncharacterized protein LOC120347139 isoform X1 [Styela clava]
MAMTSVSLNILFGLICGCIVGSQEVDVVGLWKDFPVGIPCEEAVKSLDPRHPFDPDPPTDRPGDDNENITCTITRNGNVEFNKTIIWGDRRKEGYFGDADEKWNNANISVKIFWAGDPFEYIFQTELETIPEMNCSRTLLDSTKDREEEITLSCYAAKVSQNNKMKMSEEQYNVITTTWYKDCEIISENNEHFNQEDGNYNYNEIKFESLKIPKPSYNTTPGLYHCVLDYKGNELTSISYKVCIREKFEYANNPTIVASEDEYIVEPGKSLDVHCKGNIGGNNDQTTVIWLRNNTEICRSRVNEKSDNCSSERHINEASCETLTEAEAIEAQKRRLADNFTATYTFSNADFSDSGVYTCLLATIGDDPRDKFRVTVRYAESRHKTLIIFWIILGACGVIAVIFGILYRQFSTEIRYFWKKCFGKKKETDKYLAYLVYMPDAFDNHNNNGLDVLMKYLNESKGTYYDPNKSHNDIFMTIGNDFRSTLEKCMKMVVIVTPELIQQNDIEIFKTYEGLRESVKKDLGIVFVCSKDMKKELTERARENDTVAITIKKFMKKQGNTNIVWKKNKTRRMKRALYVALPNVETVEYRDDIEDKCYENTVV